MMFWSYQHGTFLVIPKGVFWPLKVKNKAQQKVDWEETIDKRAFHLFLVFSKTKSTALPPQVLVSLVFGMFSSGMEQ